MPAGVIHPSGPAGRHRPPEWWKTKASEQDKLKILECANFLDVRELLSYLAVLPRSLHMPCVNGRADLIRALVEHKANPMVRAKYGAFLYLQVAKEEACLREINRAIRLREGWTELMLAASEGRKEFSELLLSQCLEPLVFVCVRNKDGKTALHYAAEFGCPEVINLLIERRANVGADDLNGWTALHCAASHGREGGSRKSWQSVLTMPSSFKFEIGALMLPVCDRMSQEGHFSISGHAAVSCYDCMRFVSGLFEASSHLMEYI